MKIDWQTLLLSLTLSSTLLGFAFLDLKADIRENRQLIINGLKENRQLIKENRQLIIKYIAGKKIAGKKEEEKTKQASANL